MPTRSQRLERLLRVQNQLTAMHEMRRAGHLKAAGDAARLAADIGAAKAREGSLSGLFPDVYDRSALKALAERDRSQALADAAAGVIATETARAGRIEDDLAAARREEERAAAEKAALEAIERALRSR